MKRKKDIEKIAEKLSQISIANESMETDLKRTIVKSLFNIKILSINFCEEVETIKIILNYLKSVDNNIDDLDSSSLSKIDGFTFQKDDIFFMCINDGISPNRKRFTISHEFGHIALGHITDDFVAYFRSEFQSKGSIETEANFFASVLLLPSHRVKKYIETLSEEERTVYNIAKEFNVSKQTAYFRLKNMGLVE